MSQAKQNEEFIPLLLSFFFANSVSPTCTKMIFKIVQEAIVSNQICT